MSAFKDGACALEDVNAMPAPTWGWLGMNGSRVEVPGGLGRPGAGAVDIEVAGDVRPGAGVGLATGMGDEARAYLHGASRRHVDARVPRAGSATMAVRVAGGPDLAAVGTADVEVGEDAELDLLVALDAPGEGSGLVASSVRIRAERGSRVRVRCVQTAGDGYMAFDDMGISLADDASAEVRQAVLGAGRAFGGLRAELPGDRSRIDVATDYLGRGRQVRDLNYVVRQLGRGTSAELSANGVLADESEKLLRGTIDLVRGCKGSVGTEHEAVLVAGDGVVSKTVPVILCDEDDVAGNHGATIGHVRPDQMLYLQSRGISPDAAEALFMRAVLERALADAPDARVRDAVARCGAGVLDDMEAEA